MKYKYCVRTLGKDKYISSIQDTWDLSAAWEISLHWLNLIRAFLKIGVIQCFINLIYSYSSILENFCAMFFPNLSIFSYVMVMDFNYLSFCLSLFLAITILKFSLRCCSFITQRICDSWHPYNSENFVFFTGTVSFYVINHSCLRGNYSKLHLVHSLLSGGLNVDYSQQPEPAVKTEILIAQKKISCCFMVKPFSTTVHF